MSIALPIFSSFDCGDQHPTNMVVQFHKCSGALKMIGTESVERRIHLILIRDICPKSVVEISYGRHLTLQNQLTSPNGNIPHSINTAMYNVRSSLTQQLRPCYWKVLHILYSSCSGLLDKVSHMSISWGQEKENLDVLKSDTKEDEDKNEVLSFHMTRRSWKSDHKSSTIDKKFSIPFR